jgi:phospholipase/carboxylesterase
MTTPVDPTNGNDIDALTRRQFVVAVGGVGLALAGGGAALIGATTRARRAAQDDASRLRTRAHQPSKSVTAGEHPLGLGTDRDGFLYVPTTYHADKPAPLMIMMHGATQTSQLARRVIPLMEELGIIMLAPDSRGPTWDVILGAYGPDVQFIDRALAQTFDTCAVIPHRMAIGGFSDGASYALSLGLTNGDLFSHIIAFSPGFMEPAARRGRPKIFVGHGTHDQILDIDRTSRVLVPKLKSSSYNVEYMEFEGPHTINPGEARAALAWFLA